MNEHTLKGSVSELVGRAKKYWAKLTDDDFKDFDGNVDTLKGKVQKTYGYGKEELDEHFRRFNSDFQSDSDKLNTRDRELQ